MADANVRAFPEVASTSVRATIDAALSTRKALEVAVGDLGREREKKVIERIDAFLSKSTFTPSDALKAQLELEALRKTFDEQESALRFWEQEANNRLNRLAVDSWTEVLEALDLHIAALRQQESKEQDDVDEVKSVISELEALRAELQLKRGGSGSGSSGSLGPGSKKMPPGPKGTPAAS